MKKLYLIGVGPGRPSLLTSEAKQVIRHAALKIGVGHIGQQFGCSYSIPEIHQLLQTGVPDRTALLVSGDANFFSLSKSILSSYRHAYSIETFCGVSSIQYFCSKIHQDYSDAKIISLHGRKSSIIASVSYHRRIFVLTDHENNPQRLCTSLASSGLGASSVFVGENLARPQEKISDGTAESLQHSHFDSPSVMYIENALAPEEILPLSDTEFIRGDRPMTKEEVRWLVLQKMKIHQKSIIWDIGSGTGSVSVEAARLARSGWVYAIDPHEEAIRLTEANRVKHSAFNIQIIQGAAPQCLEVLPAPDIIFIGGGGKALEVIDIALQKKDAVRFVMTAITLQSLNAAFSAFQSRNILDPDIAAVNIAKNKRVGGSDLMIALNPIYILSGNAYA